MTSSQFHFALTSKAAWDVIRNPILTSMYMRKWKRAIVAMAKANPTQPVITLYGYVFRCLYPESVKMKYQPANSARV